MMWNTLLALFKWASFFLLGIFSVYGAQYSLSVADGLPSNRVFDIERDVDGFLWFATNHGVARFDGHSVITFSAKKTPNITRSNWIRALLKDSSNKIWLVGKQGVEYLRPKLGTFNFVPAEQALNGYAIYESHSKDIWLGAEQGLYLFKNERFINIPWIKSKHLKASLRVLSISELSRGNLVLVTDEGVFTYNIDTQVSSPLTWQNGKAVFADKVWRLKNGEIWLSIHGLGLALVDPKNNSVSLKHKDLNEYDDVGYVYDFLDYEGNYYLASLNAGLLHIKSDLVSIQGDHVPLLSLYKDDQIVAYGSFNDGVSITSSNQQSFKEIAYTHKRGTAKYEINQLLVQGDKVWIADQLAGVCRYSINESLDLCVDTYSLSAQALMSDLNGNIWASVYGSLIKIDPITGKVITSYSFDELNIPDLIYSIVIQSESQFWLAHSLDGLTFFNPITKLVSRYTSDSSDLLSDQINSLALIDQKLWIAHGQGVQVLDLVSGEFSALLPEQPFAVAFGLTKMPNERVLIQSDTGLHIYNLESQAWDKAPKRLADKTIQNVIINENYAWLTHHQGLIKWQFDSGELAFYDKGDGVIPSGFHTSANWNDKVIFSSSNGLSLLDPKGLKHHHAQPVVSEVIITLDDDSRKVYHHREKLPNIPFDHSSISFKLANVDLFSPSKQKFRYKLNEAQSHWLELQDSRILMFPTLHWGDYSMLIQSTDNEGNWSNKTYRLEFSVVTPWYARWWAYTSYILSVLIIMFLLYQWRVLRLKLKQEALEQEVAEQTSEIRLQNLQLEEAKIEKAKLLRTLSHELMTPVTLLYGPAQQLQLGSSASHQKKLIKIIYNNAVRLKSLVGQLISVSNDETNQSLSTCSFNLSFICESQLQSFRELAKRKDISFKAKIKKQLYTVAEQDQLEQCISNLFNNAIKYSHEGGVISVELDEITYQENIWLSFTVKDQGIGIASSDLANIFDADYRAANGEKFEQGRGLGLYIVRKYITQLDGHIILDSQLAHGTKIQLLFKPIQPPQNDESSLIDSLSNSNLSLRDKRILLIDDTPDMLSYLGVLFTNSYTVLTAENGEQGLEVAKNQLPDLIISDVMMPKINGFSLLNKLKSDPLTAHIAVILVTANLNEARELHGLQWQADDYLTKPFNSEILQLKVRNIFMRHEHMQQHWQSRLKFNEHKFASYSGEDNPNHNEQFIIRLEGILKAHFFDCQLTVSFLAKEMALSERQFHRKLNSIVGIGASEYLRQYRLKKSLPLLIELSNITKVAEKVGFNSPAYFSACFKKHFAITPKQYIQQQLENKKVQG